MKKAPWIILSLLAACGGGDYFPVSAAKAQAVPQVEVVRFHFILRPDSAGRWYIHSDVDHSSLGVLPEVEQTTEYLRVSFDRRYTHAGVVQITSDDDFRNRVSGYCNLGLTSTTCRVVANGEQIDPARVYNYLPAGGGNFWVSVTMLNK